ncbi:MAG: hypothetical protein IT426_14415 [Pirellulales bacterium]|nr:hypothetical protein [Pirellulales bacterium]
MNTPALFFRRFLGPILLACSQGSALCGAEDAQSPKSPAWEIVWRWNGELQPPLLTLSLANKRGAALALKDWALVGKDAGEFAFADGESPPATVLEAGRSMEIPLVWKGVPPPKAKIDASLSFAHDVPIAKSPAAWNLQIPLNQIPFKFRAEGFPERIGKPAPRDDRGRILVNDGYHDDAMVAQILAAIAQDYPDLAALHEIGTTWQGRKVLALQIDRDAKRNPDKPAFLFVAAHHGNELLSIEIVLDIISQLTADRDADPQIAQWLDRYDIWCVPLANPDGCHNFLHQTGKGRKNGRDTDGNGIMDPADGVDLNRNYPFRWDALDEKASNGNPAHPWYRGPEAASEPETKALMDLADRERFVALISYHTSATRILVPYTTDGVRSPRPSAAWIVGAHLAALSDSGRPDREYLPVRNLYSVDGVDQDWHFWRYGTLAYIWEGPSTNPLAARDRQRMIAGARPGWRYLLERLASGPTLSGHVVEAKTGKPLEAVVSLDEIQCFQNEVHTSHPVTGRFDRVLPIEGVYHLRVRKDGYRTALQELTVGREWKCVRVELQPDSR